MSKNYLDMTDEDILNMNEPVEEEQVIEEEEDTEEESTEDNEELEQEEDSDESGSEEGEPIEEDDSEEGQEEESEETDESQDDLNEEKEEEDTTADDKKEKETEVAVDYKAQLESILNTPIKANGKDIKLNSAEEAVKLIQMGANYHKKMAGLKPHLKLLKTLEQNKLLDENELAFLIDVKNKNPEAIAKLLQDSEIDPLDLNKSMADQYKPQAQTVTDAEVVLEDVINELSTSAHFSKLNTVVTKEWDVNSRKVIYQDPSILQRLHEHMVPDAQGNSIYETVSAEVTKRRMLGLIDSSMSDYDAYIKTGNELHEQYLRSQQAQQATVAAKRVVKPAKSPSSNVDPQTVKKQKQLAAPTKSKVVKANTNDFNPLNLSDEEFEKLSVNQY